MFGVEVPLVISREGSGVAALACCRTVPDSLLLLIHFLCYNVRASLIFGREIAYITIYKYKKRARKREQSMDARKELVTCGQ